MGVTSLSNNMGANNNNNVPCWLPFECTPSGCTAMTTGGARARERDRQVEKGEREGESVPHLFFFSLLPRVVRGAIARVAGTGGNKLNGAALGLHALVPGWRGIREEREASPAGSSPHPLQRDQ